MKDTIEIELNSKKYTLNIKKAKELNILTEKVKHSRSNIYKYSGHDSYHILAHVGNGAIGLIGLHTGNIWWEPVTVNKQYDISDVEWKRICGNEPEKFTYTKEIQIAPME